MRIYYYFLYISILGSLSSCDRQESLAKETVESAEIKVNLFLQEGDKSYPMDEVASRLSPTRANDNDLTAGFNLYGFYTGSDIPTAIGTTSPEEVTSDKFIIDNKRVNSDGTLEGGPYHWIGNGASRHSFFAYSVSTVSSSASINTAYSGLKKNDFHPYITYTQAEDPALQEDFLVAYGPSNLIVYQSAPAINLYFRHACARVIFKIMTLGSSTLYNLDAKIKYKTKGVSKKGDVYYKPQSKTSAYNTYCSGTHSLATNLVIPSSASTEGKAVWLNDLKLVPQTLSSAWVTVSLSYKLSATATETKTSLTAVPGLTIEPDNQYTFYLTVSDRTPAITVSNVVISPWVTEKLLVDPLN